MPTSKALSSLVPWFARMCGNVQAQVDTPESHAAIPKPQWTKETALEQAALAKPVLPVKKIASREVHIDTDTAVPYELYKDLVRAGRRAKTRGQHELKESPTSVGSSHALSDRPKMHLVRPAGPK
mmetsp:Transcript_92841/g.215756  ORF Transcript_92841/g.215756 Transcript_92841/m.215756 type:complete len:125 (-) Transcript_92841:202-576(-)|eukprot:CAMPEP_0171103174 /NCGR_PEP_ID=MMETSP0766_2-20121228/58776_1 /TAXON_ID=439317 /ORGANISM="Gambierdiscus australes, Strain CAWD 149" /LENGTH=124 /DNA_ID=CAMNT_0011563583 /DNA_START=105 /DNA_END=479 /DNA_ORIENTATION=+